VTGSTQGADAPLIWATHVLVKYKYMYSTIHKKKKKKEKEQRTKNPPKKNKKHNWEYIIMKQSLDVLLVFLSKVSITCR